MFVYSFIHSLIVFVLFFVNAYHFSSSPSSYLCFREIQLPRELRTLAAHYVLAPLELELEPVQLLGREGGPRALGPVQVEAFGQDDLPDGAFGVCPANRGGKKTTNTEASVYNFCASLWHLDDVRHVACCD